MTEREQKLFDALRFVQLAIADWRDGGNGLVHPEHGLLHLEEVKYCVVDPVLEEFDPSLADDEELPFK